jgi:tetratricopeptide (TPR) repeat protein
MKIRLISLSLMLIAAGSLTVSTAQTRRTTKKRSTAAKAESSNKTRARRTRESTAPVRTTEAQTNPEKPANSSEPMPKPEGEKATVPAEAATTQTDQNAKPNEKSEPSPEPNKPPADAVIPLRDQIDAASTGTERNGLRLKLAEELVTAGKNSDALSELHAITATDVFDPQGFYNAGNSFARLGDTEGAVEAYRKAINQRKGRYSRAFNNLGVVLMRAGRWDEAYDAFLSALKLEGFRYAEASYNLGRLYSARGETDLAVREWRRVLALNPDHTAAAEALARVGSEDKVVVDSTRSSSSTPSAGPVKASVKEAPKEKPVAIKPSTSSSRSPRSLALDPISFDLLQRARTDNEKGKTLNAIDSYQRLLSRESGYFPPANLELSFALISSKRYEEAFSQLQMVATRDGNRYPISYYHLARVYELRGDLKQAESWFSQAAVAFGSQNSQFLLDVSRVREKQGDFKGALESMERYLSIMDQRGEHPSWSAERLTALREKAATKN